jgi:hypothetical protein
VGPCHHGFAHPRIADGEDGLHMWREAANTLNKQSRTANKGWSSRRGFGEGLTTPHRKELVCYQTSRRASDLGGYF